MKGEQNILAFNRGRISRHAMARIDLSRMSMAAEVQTNFMPKVLGSASLRNGLGYVNELLGEARLVPFVFASDDTACLEFTDNALTVSVDGVRIVRPSCGATITNGNFTSDISGWTVIDAGTTCAWLTGGYAALAGDGTLPATLGQTVAVVNPGVEHGISIVVNRGPVTLRIGSTSGGGEYVDDLALQSGYHSFGITPSAGSMYIRFINTRDHISIVDSCTIEAAGDMTLTSPYVGAQKRMIRYDQSGDIVFIACAEVEQKEVIRQAARSWSLQAYISDDGPFMVENTGPITMAPSALSGDITITSTSVAGRGFFRLAHTSGLGSLLKITSVGQTVTDSFSVENDFSGHIRVTGVSAGRQFAITVSGTFTANVTLQRSIDEGASWVDVATYTAVTTTTLTDGLDNQIIWYRIGIKTGGYTSGAAVCSLVYAAGSITGVARISGYVSSTQVYARVLVPFGGTTASDVWSEGEWSDLRGYPSAVKFHDSRLFWAGKDRFWGTVSDQYYTLDPEFEGDAGPIQRSIGYGPVDSISWLLSIGRLVAGTDSAEVVCRSSSQDEPLTQTNFTPKNESTQGAARISAVAFDGVGVFVQRNGRRVYMLEYSPGTGGHVARDLMELVPEMGDPGIVAIAVQRKPDTRIHCVRSDGTVAVLVFQDAEKVAAWVDIETDGAVFDVCIMPGAEEDEVTYGVERTIGGVSRYYTEKFAYDSECAGGAINKLADSFVYAAGASNTITGLSHLEGESVVAWGGGLYLGTFTVAGGSITLHASTTYTHRCAGLGYQGRFKSAKLAYSIPQRAEIGRRKRIDKVGFVLLDTHPQGIEYGPDFDTLDPLPERDRGADVSQTTIMSEYDSDPIWFPGRWDNDSRLCLVANAPKPATILAALIHIEQN